MLCPQCDSILGGGRCQNCGWNTSQPWPAFRMVAGSSFPLKDRTLYPPAAELPAPVVEPVEPVEPEPAADPQPDLAMTEPEAPKPAAETSKITASVLEQIRTAPGDEEKTVPAKPKDPTIQ